MIVDEIVGRFASASNVTLLGRAAGELVVYKPVSGARPLWDFDVATLAVREILAYRVSEALGIGVVPLTVAGSGPLGSGAVQRYIAADDGFDPLAAVEQVDPGLWPIAVLDLVVNNADRKLGHVLGDATGRLWAIDHGLTFHPEDKLRTVLWGFAGSPLPEAMQAAISRLEGELARGLAEEIATALGRDEAAALVLRVDQLVRHPVHPGPPADRPPVPWPPV